MTRLPAFTAAVAALALSACGFHPLYGTMGSNPGAQVMFGTVYVPPIELENAGYELRNDLADLMQAKVRPDNTTLYELQVTLADRRQPIAIQNVEVPVGPQTTLKEVDITRYNYTLTAKYQLVDRKTQKVLTKGTESSLSAYDVAASPYATLVAQQDVQARTARDIAEHLRIRLGIYFAQAAGTAK
jgi:LPS-assembly lipoprotein